MITIGSTNFYPLGDYKEVTRKLEKQLSGYQQKYDNLVYNDKPIDILSLKVKIEQLEILLGLLMIKNNIAYAPSNYYSFTKTELVLYDIASRKKEVE